jgi:hypothetical protein
LHSWGGNRRWSRSRRAGARGLRRGCGRRGFRFLALRREPGGTPVEIPDLARLRRGDRGRLRRGRRRDRDGPAFLDDLHDEIAHLGFDGAELVLHIDAVLAAQRDKVLALHVKLARQGKNANFVFVQAELPVLTTQT